MKHISRRHIKQLKWLLLLPLCMIIGGAAYAVLSSPPATLTGSTITTANANLLISTDGTTYSTTLPGFNFDSLVPGGPSMPLGGYNFYLKNTGNTPLAIKLRMSRQPTNEGDISLDKVNLIITPSSGSAQSLSLQSLLSAGTTGTAIGVVPLSNGVSQQYKIQVSMAADAVAGNSASLSGIDLTFTGVAGS